MMAVESDRLARHLRQRFGAGALGERCQKLSDTLHAAIKKHGIVEHPTFGKIYAYEVDGFGNSYCMDDANMPSLLGLSRLKFLAADDPIYVNTRRFILSEVNPYWFRGRALHGVGGPHIGLGFVWPMAIVTEVVYIISLYYLFDL